MESTTNQPTICILIANHNYGKYILDAISSALSQTYRQIMICVVNDACTDDSFNIILNAFFKKDSNEGIYSIRYDDNNSVFNGHINNIPITIINIKNQVGPSEARNIGIDECKDECDAFQILDADDIMAANKVAALAYTLFSSPHIAVTYGDYEILDMSTGNVIREYKEPYSIGRLQQECIVHSGAMIKKDALEMVQDQFGYYDREMRTCEDYDLWVRLAEKFIIFHVPMPLTMVRNHQENSTNSVKKEIWQRNWNRILQKNMLRNKR